MVMGISQEGSLVSGARWSCAQVVLMCWALFGNAQVWSQTLRVALASSASAVVAGPDLAGPDLGVQIRARP